MRGGPIGRKHQSCVAKVHGSLLVNMITYAKAMSAPLRRKALSWRSYRAEKVPILPYCSPPSLIQSTANVV